MKGCLGAAEPVLLPAHALPLIPRDRGRGDACVFLWYTCMHTGANLCVCVCARARVRVRVRVHVRACVCAEQMALTVPEDKSITTLYVGLMGQQVLLVSHVCGFTDQTLRCKGAPVWASCF